MPKTNAACLIVLVVALAPVAEQQPAVHTVLGTGLSGHTATQTNDPFGLAIGP